MFSYLLARWQFKRSFKPDGENFIYRMNSRAPGYRVSRQEREIFLKIFSRKYWKYHLTITSGLIFSLIAISALLFLFYNNISADTTAVLGYGFAAILVVAMLLIDRKLYSLPLETLGSRSPDVPKRSWRQANDDMMRDISWPMLIFTSSVLIGLAWLTFPRGSFELWWPILWALYFGFAAFNWGRVVLRKIETFRT